MSAMEAVYCGVESVLHTRQYILLERTLQRCFYNPPPAIGDAVKNLINNNAKLPQLGREAKQYRAEATKTLRTVDHLRFM